MLRWRMRPRWCGSESCALGDESIVHHNPGDDGEEAPGYSRSRDPTLVGMPDGARESRRAALVLPHCYQLIPIHADPRTHDSALNPRNIQRLGRDRSGWIPSGDHS